MYHLGRFLAEGVAFVHGHHHVKQLGVILQGFNGVADLNLFLLAQDRFHVRAADHGISFPMHAIMTVYPILDGLASEPESFMRFLKFLKILYDLSRSDYRILASSSFSHAERNPESRRVQKVKQFINDHYTEPLRLDELARLVGMTPTSFSRFFKLRTGKSLSDYVLDIRLGFAARSLVDTTRNVSEICFECGFNNLSNFNRIFKSRRGVTPKEFRAMYKKNKVVV